jgi:hypothetical protein
MLIPAGHEDLDDFWSIIMSQSTGAITRSFGFNNLK